MTLTHTASVETKTWQWQGFPIRYQQSGTTGPAVVLIHGFGASSDHWRKNLPVLGETCRVFALDLLGFGFSAKPEPGNPLAYSFETWGQQILDFCQEIVGEPVFLVGNSIGCVAAAQAAVMNPLFVRGVAMLDCSLRLLHDRKRLALPWYRRMSAPVLQSILSNRALGHLFFSQLANRRTIRKILLQAYGRKDAVTDELVDFLLKPAFEPGAADVFLAFIKYSEGPLAEDLLPEMTCPVLMLWGTVDPWEPIELGRVLAEFPAVEEFVPLEGVGHCPQDEAPELVNPLLQNWIARHT
ncbi:MULTISPECIES: alpha/beta fold hydrolase [unclassified Leptolyngbya]|uniref:alpha/beta fold hydrolase n=1 Tax=unclassified Leptolyngbya TaxID=2650499 RepID=UPI0016820C69|nr:MULTISPECIES: alpha/beta fold hydrolase [unclassified Leptolyngbya]MBD1910867.1 alpha/beta fold hydrolase [Leptolyngbya sp. FACHB-8]MBD2153738.1 alpha/beta fold hydrolase [Leptolyngbya sp. FACHB-16]